MKKKIALFITIFVVLISLFSVPAMAATKETVFVIGNNDSYPLEYFDSDTSSYKGVMPEILTLIEKRTDYHFVYLTSSDSRSSLIKNSKGQLVSTVINGDFKSIQKTAPFFTLKENKKNFSVSFGFTKNCSDDFKKDFSSALNTITKDEKQQILYNNIKEHYTAISWEFYFYIILGIMAALIIILIIVNRFISKKSHITSLYYFGTRYIYKYASLFHMYDVGIKDAVRTQYCSVTIHALLDVINQKNYKTLKEIGAVINSRMNKDDFFGYVGHNTFCLIIKNDVQSIIDQIKPFENDLKEVISSTDSFDIVYGIHHITNNDRVFDVVLEKTALAENHALDNDLKYFVYDQDLVDKATKQQQFEDAVITALENKEFYPFFQALVNPHTRAINMVEVSPRWDSPIYGLVEDKEIHKFLRNKDKLKDLDLLIFERVCEWVSYRNVRDKPIVPVLCNFSKRDFLSNEFIESIIQTINKTKCPMDMIIFEIREKDRDTDTTTLSEIVAKLHKLGLRVSLDSAGMATISFDDIFSLDVDYIKIDESILNKVGVNKTTVIMLGLVQAFHEVNIKVVANNISDEETQEKALRLQSDLLEGALYHTPVSMYEMERLIDKEHNTL